MKIDISKHWNIAFILLLAVISYSSFLFLLWLEHFLPIVWQENIKIFHAFTALGIFIIYLKLFKKYAWKWKIFSTFGIVDFPNISGKWKGTFKSSFKDSNGNDKVGDALLTINQTFDKVSVYGKFNKSKSTSTGYHFAFDEQKRKQCLNYNYKNEVGAEADADMRHHSGSAKIWFNDDGCLEGEYFSDGQRGTHGSLVDLCREK